MIKYLLILLLLFQTSNLYSEEYDHYDYWIYTGEKIKVAWDTFPDVIEHQVELFHVEQNSVVAIGRTPLPEIELVCPRSGHYFVRVRSSYFQAPNLLINGCFEYDVDGDSKPDDWIVREPIEVVENSVGVPDAGHSAKIESLGTIDGEYISVIDGIGGYAEYTFNISESGTYFIWGKVLGRHAGANSFYISADNGSDVKWSIPVSANWIWVKAMSVSFDAGQHTIIVKQREKQTQLDKILITNEPDYVYQDPVDDMDLPLLIEAESGVLQEPMESAVYIETSNNINIQNVILKPFTSYLLRARIKTENVNLGTAQVYPYNHDGIQYPENWIKAEGTTDWTLSSMRFTTGVDPSEARINFRLFYATGIAWFDCIELMEEPSIEDVVWSDWADSSNKDYAAVNSEPRSWWIYSRVAPPSGAVID
jgi:hypothetical protein